MGLMKRLINDEEGQGLVEYVLLFGFIVLVVMIGVKNFGKSLNALWANIGNMIDTLPIPS